MFIRHHYVVCLIILISVAAVSSAALPTQWPEVLPDTPQAAGFARSLKLEPPSNELLSPEQVLEMARRIPGGDAGEDWMSVVLFSYDSTAFDAQGYFHLIQQEAIRVIDQRAIQEHQTVRLSYDIPYDRTRVLNAYVIDPDGTVTYLDTSHVKDVSNSDDMDVNIYEPIWRSLIISFPGIKPGSIIYYAYENVAVFPRTPDSFQWGHTFRSTRPVVSARIRLKGLSGIPIYWEVKNNDDNLVTFTEQMQGDHRVYHWESGFAEMIQEEPYMIPANELTTSLNVTTDTWESFSGREAPLIEANLMPDAAIEKKVEELTGHLKTDYEKMQALFNYVTKKVRYMGVAFGDRPGVNPDPVTRTFSNNAGVCKDKAGLLTAMLRLAGIDASYALNNPEERIEQRVAVDQFNHAIVVARLPGEANWRYLDVTSDLSRTMCPASSGGTQVLRIVPTGGAIETIPVSEPVDNRGSIIADTWIGKDGSLKSDVVMSGKGQSDQYIREVFYYTEARKYDGLFEWLVEKISSQATVDNCTVIPSQLDDLTVPVEVSFSYAADNFGINAGNYFLGQIPMTQLPFNWFFMDLQEACCLSDRKYPMDLVSTSQTLTRETIHLPDGYRLKAIPDDLTFDCAALSFRRTWTLDGIIVTMEQELTIKTPRVLPEDYYQLREIVKQIRKSGESYLILEVK